MWLESESGGHVAMWLISSFILGVLVHALQRLDSEGSWGRRRKFLTASLLFLGINVAGKKAAIRRAPLHGSPTRQRYA